MSGTIFTFHAAYKSSSTIITLPKSEHTSRMKKIGITVELGIRDQCVKEGDMSLNSCNTREVAYCYCTYRYVLVII